MFELRVNGQTFPVEADPDTPLLWVLREQLGLTGTKYGCGVGMCGACTVHFNGVAMRSCLIPAMGAVGVELTTIEGLDSPVQEAWIAHQVPQCGYCQSGQIMAAAAMLQQVPMPTEADVDRHMTNLCRCATYDRMRHAIDDAARRLRPAPVETAPSPGDHALPPGDRDGSPQ
jgi:isoquinoline 1-oxidoreductase alpha subunit